MKRLLLASAILAIVSTMLIASAAPAPWKPAVVTHVSALGDSKGFTIVATVRLPQPCYNVRIARALIMIYPPHYVVDEQYKGGMCTDVITMRTVKQHFDAKPWPQSVNVYALDTNGKSKHWVLPIIIETK